VQGLTSESLSRTIDVNCRAPLVLAHHYSSEMARRGRGGILLVSSMSALQGSARVVPYAATKAYEHVLAEGMWEELREEGVDVLAVLPGLTDTPGLAVGQPSLDALTRSTLTSAEEVAETALEGLGKRASVTVGSANRVAATLLGKLLPRKWAVRFVGQNMRRMYD
jgi:short-subunit dehydrogenase